MRKKLLLGLYFLCSITVALAQSIETKPIPARILLNTGEELVGFVLPTERFTIKILFSPNPSTIESSYKTYSVDEVTSFHINDSILFKSVEVSPTAQQIEGATTQTSSKRLFVNIVVKGKLSLGLIEGSLPLSLAINDVKENIWYVVMRDSQDNKILNPLKYKAYIGYCVEDCPAAKDEIFKLGLKISLPELKSLFNLYNSCKGAISIVYPENDKINFSKKGYYRWSIFLLGNYGTYRISPAVIYPFKFGYGSGFGGGISFESFNPRKRFRSRYELAFQSVPLGWSVEGQPEDYVTQNLSMFTVSYLPKFLVSKSSLANGNCFYATAGLTLGLDPFYKNENLNVFLSWSLAGQQMFGPVGGFGFSKPVKNGSFSFEARYAAHYFLEEKNLQYIAGVFLNSYEFKRSPLTMFQIRLAYTFRKL